MMDIMFFFSSNNKYTKMSQTGGKKKKTVRKVTKRKVAKRKPVRTAKRKTRRRSAQHGGTKLTKVPAGSVEAKKMFIRPPTMQRMNPKQPWMTPPNINEMNEIDGYLQDYYLNTDIDALSRKIFGAAVHNRYNTNPAQDYSF
jgi:hypothetical protein